MIEATGDLWWFEDAGTVKAITTNGFVKSDGRAVMGAGVARQARDRFPGLDLKLVQLIIEHGNRCFRLRHGTQLLLLSFPVKPITGLDGQPGWMAPAEINIITRSCTQAMEMADRFDWQQVVLPRPGCGNGGLDYDTQVRPAIVDLLDDRFLIINRE